MSWVKLGGCGAWMQLGRGVVSSGRGRERGKRREKGRDEREERIKD